ncbi:membrane transporter [Sanghuangporus baumii]|uniref:Membrane transporter n=1 Tax=Sanghuangporus baumii TaxID=108892 RepID=A0A9Q5N9C7_SANBA|nr:membrane transporter [Sanghuangporus baumii]
MPKVMMNGAAEIVNGCIAFGVLHINSPGFKAWHWLVIICGILTVIASVCFWFLFPDSPTNAWFLTPKERVIAVNRIRTNQAGVENKHFKKEQLIECLTDLKTWIFFFYALFRNVPNSLINQNSIIIQSFGFTTLQTTLLSCINGVVKMTTVFTGVNLAAYLKNGLAYSGVLFYIPSVTCAILVNVLPGSDRAGLLVTQYLVGVEVLGSPIGKAWVTQATAGHTKRITMNAILLIAESLGNTIGPQMWLDRFAPGSPIGKAWVTQATAGHTKRITMNAILLIAESLGNTIGPQMWLDSFAPRYHVPWAIIAICYSSAAVLLLIQRYVLNRENKKRDTETPDHIYDDVWIKVTDENGDITEKRVDKAFLDLTDKQNRDFRYVLFRLIECLTDFKTWIFFCYALSRIHLSTRTASSSSSRSALIQTTLLSCINGIIKMTTIFITSRVLLVQFSVETLGAPSGKAWVTQATAGHTKRITVNAMLLIAGSLGNAIGPQMWLDKFATR